MKKRIVALLIVIIIFTTYIPTLVASAAVPDIKGWSISLNGGCKGSAEIDYDTGVDGTPSLKIVCESNKASNVYMLLTARVPVEAGKTYTYGGTVKSENSTEVQSMIDWGGRSSLLLYGRTSDFKKYEFKYVASTTDTVQLMFLIEGKTNGVWFDDMFFIDDDTKQNLLTNPDFNDEEEQVKSEVAENEYQQKFMDINSGSEYNVADTDRLGSLFHNIPVFYKEDIVVDADDSDWEDVTMAYMPIITHKQLQIYAHDDEREKDLKVNYAFAYDEEYFYMYYNVYDDLIETNGTLSDYWRGDSIQFMLSEESETTGYEFGLIHDTKTNSGKIFSSAVDEEMLNKCIVSTKREEKYTTYEAAIPWGCKYKERPDEILFDFIINDNDYAGRTYCVQLAPGIAEGKMNTEYPELVMVEKGQDWYAWIDGEPVPDLNEETIYSLYLSNYSEGDKNFTINANGVEKDIYIKPGMGYRESIPMTFTEEKKTDITATVMLEGKVYEISTAVESKKAKPTSRVAKSYQKEITEFANEIEALIAQCEEKGISTDYEKVSLQTIRYFEGFMSDDISNGDLARINYTYDQISDIYNDTKKTLEGYLSGESVPLKVPQYKTSKINVDGTVTYADTFDGEIYENRPVFFVGYGHFSTASTQMPVLKKLGANSIQNEIGIRDVIVGPDSFVEGSTAKNKADVTFNVQTEVKHSGERAFKIVNKTPAQSNVYGYFSQRILVKPNTSYKGSAWICGKNAHGLSIATDGWNGRVYYTVPEEWEKIEFSFTSGEGQYARTIMLLSSDICDEFYIDDISIKEEGSDEELFANGGFEAHVEENSEYTYSESGPIGIYSYLSRAEDNNFSADVLLSPHYMYSDFYNKHPDAKTEGGGFMGYDVNHPAARKVVEDYLRFIVPKLAKYKSLNSICLTNEPSFHSKRIPSYKEKWYDFLEEKYESIDKLNDVYKSGYNRFEEIEMPLELTTDPVCIDYQIFNDIQFSSWHNWMAEIIHELAPGIPVHFKVMPYTNSYEGSHARSSFGGGYSLEYTADTLDINGCDSHNYITDGAGNKIQTMWYDFQVSIKDAPVFDTEHHIMADRADRDYSDEYDAYAVTNIWQGAIHYRANSVIWAWERTYDKNADYWGLMTQRPKAVWGTGIATNDLNRLSYQIEAIQKEKTDIAILYSPSTRMYDTTKMNMIYETYNALMCLGKKVKFVTEIQIGKVYDYDILFVPGVDHAHEETVDTVINYINNGGKVVLLGDNCFKYTAYMNDANPEKINYILEHSTLYPNIKSDGNALVGMTQREYKNLIRDYLKSEGKIHIEVLSAETGGLCDDIEYNVAVYDEKILVNICNYGEDVDVNVCFGGEKVEKSTELRSMTEQGETVRVKQYMPILLEIETDNLFIDTYGHWAEHKISDAYEKNLVSGESRTRFVPERKITRAEFVTMLVRAAEMRPKTYEDVFYDVNAEEWYARYMQPAYEAGIIKEVYARPNDFITREEMCDMVVSAYERNCKANVFELSFDDIANISDKVSVSKAFGLGVIRGYDDNTFRPQNGLTRAEAVTVILDYYNLKG